MEDVADEGDVDADRPGVGRRDVARIRLVDRGLGMDPDRPTGQRLRRLAARVVRWEGEFEAIEVAEDAADRLVRAVTDAVA